MSFTITCNTCQGEKVDVLATTDLDVCFICSDCGNRTTIDEE